MYKALYRTERPEVLSEVIGQEHIIRVIKNQLKTGRVGHAYLFCGTRGTGKTTLARLLAKGVNCTGEGERPCGECANCKAVQEGNFIDLIEVDAASNNGVDYIRNLRDSVNYPPTIGRKKVYIIDEVHMLSNSAFNAFLKTLEEPPEHVMFILATTDPQKITQTILSRCIRFDFKRVPEKQILAKMESICEKRGVKMEDEALRLLASNADGSVRDGLSLLEQCLACGDEYINRDMVLDFLGAASQEFFLDLTEKVILHNTTDALTLLNSAIEEGKDSKLLMMDWMAHYRSLLISKFIAKPEEMLNMSTENIVRLKEQGSHMGLDEINEGIITLSKTINDAKYSTQPRILLELAIVTLASGISVSGTKHIETVSPVPRTVPSRVVAKPAVQPAAKLAEKPVEKAAQEFTVRPEDGQPEKPAPKPTPEAADLPPWETEGAETGQANSEQSAQKPVRHAQTEEAQVTAKPGAMHKESAKQEVLSEYGGGMNWDEIMAQAESFQEADTASEEGLFGGMHVLEESDVGEAVQREKSAEQADGRRENFAREMPAVENTVSSGDAEAHGESFETLSDGYSTEELDEIWGRICNRATDSKPSLYVALNGSALLRLSPKEILVSMRTDYARQAIERDRELLMDYIEAETGFKGYLKFRAASEAAEEEVDDRSAEVANEIKDKWGLDVKIQ